MKDNKIFMSPVFVYTQPHEVAYAAEWIMNQVKEGDVIVLPFEMVDDDIKPNARRFMCSVEREKK